MPNIFHQSVEDILKAATPEQKLLWNYIFLRWGERVAVSQFYFQGTFAREIMTYSANKIYVCYEFEYSGTTGISVGGASILFYNEANALFSVLSNNNVVWDVTAAAVRYLPNSCKMQNFYFSRLDRNTILQGKFIGYRIGI